MTDQEADKLLEQNKHLIGKSLIKNSDATKWFVTNIESWRDEINNPDCKEYTVWLHIAQKDLSTSTHYKLSVFNKIFSLQP